MLAGLLKAIEPDARRFGRDDIDEPTALRSSDVRAAFPTMARGASNGFARPPGSSRRFLGTLYRSG